MNQKILKTIHKFVFLPMLIYSIYLTVIYSNDFWMRMIGSSYLAISIILLVSTAIAIYLSIRVFSEINQKVNGKSLYFLFTIISFFMSLSLIYYTRDIKTMECAYWINIFLNENKETFYVSCFNQIYDSFTIMNSFVHTRIIYVHDSLICITIITFIVFVYFTFSFKKDFKIKKFKKAKKIQDDNEFPQAESTNNIDDDEDHSYSIHDDQKSTQSNMNSTQPRNDPVPPWVIPQSSDSETPPQQPWVLSQSNQNSDQKPQPQTQPRPQPRPQPGKVEYEYEYEYEYDDDNNANDNVIINNNDNNYDSNL